MAKGWLEKNLVLAEKESILIDCKEPDRDEEGNYLIDVAYRRVSTEKQSFEGFGLEIQLSALEKVVKEENSTACLLITDLLAQKWIDRDLIALSEE